MIETKGSSLGELFCFIIAIIKSLFLSKGRVLKSCIYFLLVNSVLFSLTDVHTCMYIAWQS